MKFRWLRVIENEEGHVCVYACLFPIHACSEKYMYVANPDIDTNMFCERSTPEYNKSVHGHEDTMTFVSVCYYCMLCYWQQ